MQSSNIIELKNISKTYGEKRIIDSISMEISKGDYIAFWGKSGCGKSTLMNIVGLLDTKYSGDLYFDSVLVTKKNAKDIRKNRMGFIFQLYYLVPELSVKDNILMPYLYIDEYDKDEIEKRYSELISRLDIEKFSSQKIETLSGGEKQRVAIARAMIHNPDVIICDEPTGNLDSYNKSEVMKILDLANEDGKTILIVTHDESVASHAKKIYEIINGKLYEKNFKTN